VHVDEGGGHGDGRQGVHQVPDAFLRLKWTREDGIIRLVSCMLL
jgi:hypothetical protein